MTTKTHTDDLMLALRRLQTDLRRLISKQDVNMSLSLLNDTDGMHRLARAVRELEDASRVLDDAVSGIGGIDGAGVANGGGVVRANDPADHVRQTSGEG